MASLPVSCPGMWGLPGWDIGLSKCLDLIIYSSNCKCAYESDAEGMKMLFALRQMQLGCINCSGNRLPCFPSNILWLGLAVSFSQWCRWTSYQKKPHKSPKRNRRKAFLSGMGTRDLPGWVSAPGLLCEHTHIHGAECLFWTSCPVMEDTLFIK